MNDHDSRARRKDLQLAALAASATVVTCFLVYWFMEIQEVRAMLKLAYG